MLYKVIEEIIEKYGSITVAIIESNNIELCICTDKGYYCYIKYDSEWRFVDAWNIISSLNIDVNIERMVNCCRERYNLENAPDIAYIDRILEDLYEREESLG